MLDETQAKNNCVLAEMKRWEQDAKLVHSLLHNDQIKLSRQSGLRAARKLREANRDRQALQDALARVENAEQQALEMAQSIADLRMKTADLLASLESILTDEEKTR